jgi:hypothetical protein
MDLRETRYELALSQFLTRLNEAVVSTQPCPPSSPLPVQLFNTMFPSPSPDARREALMKSHIQVCYTAQTSVIDSWISDHVPGIKRMGFDIEIKPSFKKVDF